MRMINENDIRELNQLVKSLELENPDLTILEFTEMRTSKIEELTAIEAAVLIHRFNEFNGIHYVEIKNTPKA